MALFNIIDKRNEKKREQEKLGALQDVLNNPEIGGTPYPVKTGGIFTPAQHKILSGILAAGGGDLVADVLKETGFPEKPDPEELQPEIESYQQAKRFGLIPPTMDFQNYMAVIGKRTEAQQPVSGGLRDMTAPISNTIGRKVAGLFDGLYDIANGTFSIKDVNDRRRAVKLMQLAENIWQSEGVSPAEAVVMAANRFGIPIPESLQQETNGKNDGIITPSKKPTQNTPLVTPEKIRGVLMNR